MKATEPVCQTVFTHDRNDLGPTANISVKLRDRGDLAFHDLPVRRKQVVRVLICVESHKGMSVQIKLDSLAKQTPIRISI